MAASASPGYRFAIVSVGRSRSVRSGKIAAVGMRLRSTHGSPASTHGEIVEGVDGVSKSGAQIASAPDRRSSWMGSKRSNVASSLKKSVDDRRLSQSSKGVLPRWPSKNDVAGRGVNLMDFVIRGKLRPDRTDLLSCEVSLHSSLPQPGEHSEQQEVTVGPGRRIGPGVVGWQHPETSPVIDRALRNTGELCRPVRRIPTAGVTQGVHGGATLFFSEFPHVVSIAQRRCIGVPRQHLRCRSTPVERLSWLPCRPQVRRATPRIRWSAWWRALCRRCACPARCR